MKKVISIMLTVAMLLSMFTVTFANDYPADAILISSASELKTVADEINANGGTAGKTYVLTADIDMGNEPWTKFIGTKDAPFEGTFDGNGCVISNFRISAIDNAAYGIFGYVGGDALISELGIKNVAITLTVQGKYEVNAGGLAGVVGGNAEVSGCFAKDVAFALNWDQSLDLGQFGDGAGLIGEIKDDAVVDSCYSLGYVYAKTDRDAGLVGGAYGNAAVINSYSDTTLVRCMTNESAAAVVNSYYLQAPSWPYAGTVANTYPGTKISPEQLREYHTTLGDAFVKGSASNSGYPAFEWEPVPAVITGTGTETDPFMIYNLDNLLEIATMTDTDGKYFELVADIDINGKTWSTYIGTASNPFKGIFDGNGYIIKNFKYEIPGYSAEAFPIGLFGVVGGDAVIKNLGVKTVKVGTTATYGYNSIVGGIVAKLTDNAKIDNCYVKNIVINTKDATGKTLQLGAAGAIAGEVDGEGTIVTNCYSLGFEELNDSAASEDGLIGRVLKTKEISNCYSDTTLVCISKEYAEKVTNSYSVSKKSWAADNFLRAGEVKSAAELKGMVETLGDAYKAGGMENSGFPALEWEEVSAVVIEEGSGTYKDPYLIKSASNLAAITYIDDTEGVYFKLMNDIDLGGVEWLSYIGNEVNMFKGDFNGNGHKITNYTLTANAGQIHGLFGVAGGKAHIYDLGIEDVTVNIPKSSSEANAGGLIGVMMESSSITRCYAKNIVVEADWKITDKNQGQLKTFGGLVGLLDGAGVEIHQCYALGVDTGVKDFTLNGEPAKYHLIDKDGGVVGQGKTFLVAEKMFSDTYVMRYNANIWVEDSYQSLTHQENDEGYKWPWLSNVNYLGYAYQNDYYITPGNTVAPKLKWEEYSDKYLNLVTGGTMSVTEADANKIFGTTGAKIYASPYVGLASTIMELPASTELKYDVDLEAGQYYRVSFKGRTKSSTPADGGFTFTLGGRDLTEELVDVDLSSGWNWDTKVVFVKAATTGKQTLVIKGNEDLYIDDVEIIKVDLDYEKLEASECLNLAYHRIDTLNSNIYVQVKICDGLEVTYAGEYIDDNGTLLVDKIPVGLGVASDTFTATVKFDDVEVVESIDINVAKQAPYVVKNVGLVDDKGNTVYDVDHAAKVATVDVIENVASDAKLLVALYAGDKLTTIKTCEITDAGCNVDLAIADGVDKVKLFVMADGSFEPLALPNESFDTLDENSKVTIHTVGDSICATYADADVLKGWGQKLQQFFDEEHVVVDNTLSRGGMSALEFVQQPERLATLLPKLKKNDVVVIQLSHNDASKCTQDEFKALLCQIIDGAREKGAIPMVLTSPVTTGCGTDTPDPAGGYVINSVLKGYPETFKELAAEKNLPVVDLYEHTKGLFKELGYSGVMALGQWASDTVHFTSKGADYNAKFLAEGIRDLQLPIGQFVIAE